MISQDELLLIGKKESQPVLDGLLFWLDGQDTFYGDTRAGTDEPALYMNSHMFDRVANTRVDFAMAGANGLCLRQEVPNILTVLYPGGSSTSRQDGTVSTALNDVKTIEIVMSGGLFPTYIAGSYVTFSNGSVKYGNATVNGSLDTISSGYFSFMSDDGKNTIYKNGLSITSANGSAVIADNFTRIVGIRSSRQLGSVRFYNRNLTAEEMQQNLEYEISVGRVAT